MKLRDVLYVAGFSENCIEVIRNNGLGLEINRTCISADLDSDPQVRQRLMGEIRREIKECGTDRIIMHGPFTEIYPAAIDPMIREAGMLRLNQAWEVLEALGGRTMVVHTGWLPDIYSRNYQNQQGAQFWKRFMADKPEDFCLLIENVLEEEPYMMAELMGMVNDPRAGICLDLGHVNAAGTKTISMEEWIGVLAPYIRHVHLHSNDGSRDSHGALGSGTADVRGAIDLIRRLCGEGVSFTVEALDCRASVAWLKEQGLI